MSRRMRPLSLLPLATALVLVPLTALADEREEKADARCAAMGEGFRRVPGTDTCMQLSGAIDFTITGGRALGNAPNQGFYTTPTPAPAPPAASDPWKRTR